jgi:hypothetical protein
MNELITAGMALVNGCPDISRSKRFLFHHTISLLSTDNIMCTIIMSAQADEIVLFDN